MLFHIDDSVAQVFENGANLPADDEALRYLLLGVAEGNHRLSGSRRTLGSLSTLNILTPLQKRAAARALGRVAQEGNLKHQLPVVGRIVSPGPTTPQRSTSGAQEILTFPLRWFDRSAKIQPTVLLGENLADVSVCKLISEAAMHLAGFPYLPLAFSNSGGGGSAIGIVLAHHIQQDLICICVVDSDKYAPGSAPGNTSNTLAIYRNKTMYPLVDILITEGRELENLLPDGFYEARYGQNTHFQVAVELLLALSRAGENDVRSYVDIKNGVRLHDILRMGLGTTERVFWDAKKSVFANLGANLPTGFPCEITGVCANGARHLCTCNYFSGIQSNILTDFTAFQAGRTRYHVASDISQHQNPWRQMGPVIGSWGCADERVRL